MSTAPAREFKLEIKTLNDEITAVIGKIEVVQAQLQGRDPSDQVSSSLRQELRELRDAKAVWQSLRNSVQKEWELSRWESTTRGLRGMPSF